MLAAMGGLTNDPKYYVRALELSRGQFYDAHVALGKLSYDKGDLREALGHFNAGLAIKPLMPAVWFRVGTICMHLGEWDAALRAFTEVVKQEPEEGDAWANVAAIHTRNKNPTEAYPALVEVSQTSTAKCYIFRTILFLTLNPCQIVAETKPQQLEGVGK
jgi:tetratricopeptide (TPR) repeat protein